MNGPPGTSARPGGLEVRGILQWFQRNTIVALVLLLLLFIAIVELLKPGTVNPVWLSNTLLFAAPLGILAAGQTMVMLTGGRGGITGPVIAAFVLTIIPADLIFLNIDPYFGQVIQGTLIVLVVMTGG
ncbi:MAG TPA: hypothetical protein VFE60_10060, partial [Roseiarcus sp.]|nr:hypothetical protein [Roseiarcus sp.]